MTYPKTKICSMCGVRKRLECYTNGKKGLYGKCSRCKKCRVIVVSQYNKDHKDERLAYQKKLSRTDYWREYNRMKRGVPYEYPLPKSFLK